MKSHTKIFLFTIVYVTIKNSKYLKIDRVNPLCLIFSKVNGYFEEMNGNKYLLIVPTNESKEKILKNEELRIKIRYLIRLITKKLR